MAMTKMNFFDKHVEGETQEYFSAKLNIHLNLNFNSKLSGLAKVSCRIGTQSPTCYGKST